MTSRYQNNIRIWSDLAVSDPLWAVLSHPDKRGGKWNETEFYATGLQDWLAVKARMSELGLNFGTQSALDFGCGVGRLSLAMAKDFEQVTGLDAAAGMVDLAQKKAKDKNIKNCRFVLSQAEQLESIPRGSQDLIISLLCLQHIPPTQSKRFVTEFLKVLKPGGILIFNLPVGRKNYWLMKIKRFIQSLAGFPQKIPYEMNFIPLSAISRMIKKNGGQIVALDPENIAPKFDSKRFIIQKLTN
jgi:ubiquinone/menaquinone biosynthesis C-methylase UbiE